MRIKNCDNKSIGVQTFNGKDSLEVAPYDTAKIKSGKTGKLKCKGQGKGCKVALNGQSLGGGYKGYFLAVDNGYYVDLYDVSKSEYKDDNVCEHFD